MRDVGLLLLHSGGFNSFFLLLKYENLSCMSAMTSAKREFVNISIYAGLLQGRSHFFESEGAQTAGIFFRALFALKTGRTQVYFYLSVAQKVEGTGPPGGPLR